MSLEAAPGIDSVPLPPPHFEVPHPGLYRATSKVFELYHNSRGGVYYHGLENLPPRGEPFMAAPVHRSMRDIPVVSRMFLEDRNASIYALAKDTLWGKKFLFGAFGGYLALCGAIKLDRHSSLLQQGEVLERIHEIRENNGILAVFPEGTRKMHSWETVEREDIKSGVGYIAVRYGLKISPIGIAGTSRHSKWPVHLAVEEPVDVPYIPEVLNNRKAFVDAGRNILPGVLDELHSKLQKAQNRAINERLGLA